jgi:hypothetical protein
MRSGAGSRSSTEDRALREAVRLTSIVVRHGVVGGTDPAISTAAATSTTRIPAEPAMRPGPESDRRWRPRHPVRRPAHTLGCRKPLRAVMMLDRGIEADLPAGNTDLRPGPFGRPRHSNEERGDLDPASSARCRPAPRSALGPKTHLGRPGRLRLLTGLLSHRRLPTIRLIVSRKRCCAGTVTCYAAHGRTARVINTRDVPVLGRKLSHRV